MSAKKTVHTEKDLVATIKSLDAQIATHEALRREIPLNVLQPQVEEALGRVRQALSRGALPSTAAPPFLQSFKVGEEVTVTMSPEQRARVLGATRDPETGEEARILITESGEFVTAKLSELGAPMSSPGPSTSQGSTPQPPAPGPRNQSDSTLYHSGLQPGDRVNTPQGPGVIVREMSGSPGIYEISGPPNSPFYMKAEDLTLQLPSPEARTPATA